ncbi:hypothetical protein KW794_02470 [Candidatus Saccharibacteria bacterium]|nr:hypothetical protein [Candidatus Saccharibacteria bacterium]
MLLSALGVAAITLQIAGFIPYVIDILKGKTKPERASFWIFSLLVGVTLVAQLLDNITWAAALVFTSFLCVLTIAVLSLRYGYGSFHTRDTVSIILAIIGVLVWQVTSEPLVAIAMVILIDFAGFWLTLLKTWKAPHTETLFAWVASGLAAILAIIASQNHKAVQIAYLLYSALAGCLISALIIYRRKVLVDSINTGS